MGTLNDRTYEYLGGLGFSGSLNDRMVAYWASEGFSGSFNDKCKAFLKTSGFKTLNKWMEGLDSVPQTYALVGNSLMNFGLDHSVASILAELAHPTDTVVQQITFNQNLLTNWNNPSGRTTGIDVKAYLASDSADYLALVDLPALNDSDVDVAPAVVDWWQQADNADLRGTFYQMWYPIPDFDTTPNWVLWKAFITFLRPHHDRVLYDVRAALGGPEVLLAPVADVLVAIYDAIEAEELDADFADFWYDALHINELGYYVAALTHWAVMHQQSPVGLPWSFSPAIPGLTAPLAAALQAKVWAVVNADAYAKPGSWPSTVIPAAFTSGQWTATAGDTLISIGIGSLPNNGGSTITDVEYELNASGTWVSSGGTGNFNITGLTNTTSYDVRIRAKNSVGSGRRSDVKARTPVSSATAPSAFTSGQWTATPGVDKITVAVSALPSDGGSAITAIQYRVDSGSWTASGISGTGSFDIAGLTRGTAYAVTIRAVNAIGSGSASDSKSATPPWQCSLTAALFDFGGGDGFTGHGASPWALSFGSKNREPITSLTLIGAYYFNVNGLTTIAFQGDQTSTLAGMSVYFGSTEAKGSWGYQPTSDFGVAATVLQVSGVPLSVTTYDMQIRLSS